MQHFIDQAIHNERFNECVHSNFPDSFFDWKITVLFYSAIHYLKALAANRNIDIGNTHTDIEYNCSPDRRGHKMLIARRAWSDYKSLYRYSHTARYDGLTDIETFEKFKEIDYGCCKVHLEAFKKYIKGQGLPITCVGL